MRGILRLSGILSFIVCSFGLVTLIGVKSLKAQVIKKQTKQESKKTTQKPKKKMTQIEAHFAIPNRRGTLLDKVKEQFQVDDKNELVQDLIKQERAHQNYYTFYHSCDPRFRLVQDLYKKFYEFFALKANIKNFVFFRWNDPIFDTYSTADEFLKKEIEARGLIDDNISDVKTFIMSVNLSPFGGIGIGGETTWNYFVTGLSHFDPLAKILPGFFEKAGLNKRFIDELREIYEIIATPEGTLYQIFIPKNMADKIAYLSWRHGIPNDPDNPEFIVEMFGSIYGGKMDEIRAYLERVQDAHMRGEQTFRAQIDLLFKAVNDGRFKVSTFLERFKVLPDQFKEPNMVQARLLFTNDMLLNPDSGILVYRYTTVPEEKMRDYEIRLSKVVDQILVDWLDRNSNPETTTLSGDELSRVKNLLVLMKQGRDFTSQEQVPTGADVLGHIKTLQELKERQASTDKNQAQDKIAKLEQELEAKRKAHLKDLWEQEKAAQGAEVAQVKALEALEIQRAARAEKPVLNYTSFEAINFKNALMQISIMNREDARSGAVNSLLTPHQAFMNKCSDEDLKTIIGSLDQVMLKKQLVQVSDPTTTFNKYKKLYNAVGIKTSYQLITERNK
ncbi:cell envelope integrity protein TolA [Candidatus Dependentiae bacterium]|nr:cell envelope integrity protein TolA [Candidatus Dependentiae bacterium]